MDPTGNLAINPKLLYIRELTAQDMGAAADFSCGDTDLDDFLRSDALRLQEQDVTRTFTAMYTGELAGYVALLVDAIELKSGERKKLGLSHQDHPVVPALKVARLAVAMSLRNQGLGKELMRFALAKVRLLARHSGCRLLTVDAYPDAIEFYRRLGFVPNRATRYQDRLNLSMRFDPRTPHLPAWVIGE